MNRLREEDIGIIVQTSYFRKEEERYSRRVGMTEIEKNDFNLNISRYISTAVAEDEIDLKAIHTDLVEIEKEIRTATAKHNPQGAGITPITIIRYSPISTHTRLGAFASSANCFWSEPVSQVVG